MKKFTIKQYALALILALSATGSMSAETWSADFQNISGFNYANTSATTSNKAIKNIKEANAQLSGSILSSLEVIGVISSISRNMPTTPSADTTYNIVTNNDCLSAASSGIMNVAQAIEQLNQALTVKYPNPTINDYASINYADVVKAGIPQALKALAAKFENGFLSIYNMDTKNANFVKIPAVVALLAQTKALVAHADRIISNVQSQQDLLEQSIKAAKKLQEDKLQLAALTAQVVLVQQPVVQPVQQPVQQNTQAAPVLEEKVVFYTEPLDTYADSLANNSDLLTEQNITTAINGVIEKYNYARELLVKSNQEETEVSKNARILAIEKDILNIRIAIAAKFPGKKNNVDAQKFVEHFGKEIVRLCIIPAEKPSNKLEYLKKGAAWLFSAAATVLLVRFACENIDYLINYFASK